jgi:hypothetical protein
MLDRHVIAILRPVHGTYNILILLFFWYQAFLGFSIRKARRAGGSNQKAVRYHRKIGPVLAILAISGYAGGAVLGFLDSGRVMKYPFHFFTGSAIVMLIILSVIVSRFITYGREEKRNLHLSLGILLLGFYALQALLGLGILF